MGAIIFFLVAAYMCGCLLHHYSAFLQMVKHNGDTADCADENHSNGLGKDDKEVQITWDDFGNAPMFDDQSDQGAVDIALKIQDLEMFEESAQSDSRRLFYRNKILIEARRLAEVTLLQIAPPPETPKPVWAEENIVTFDEFKNRKKD